MGKIIEPDGKFKIFEDLFSVVLIFYEMLVVPLILSFTEMHVPLGITSVSYFITVYFLIDICINFNTAYYYKGNLILDRKLIIFNYLKGTFQFVYLIQKIIN